MELNRLITFAIVTFARESWDEIGYENKQEEEKVGESGGSSSNTISEGDDLGEIVVPSTPKSKMKKKADDKISKDDENVMQTPLSKLNRIPTRKNEKLAALLEKSLKNQSQQQQPRKRSSLPVIRGKMQSKKLSRSSMPSSSSTSTLINVPRTRSARVNLNERFALIDRLNEESDPPPATRSPATPQTILSDASLDKCIIERYRKRIEAVRHSARKSDKNEVFYGRCTSRRNLFDDSVDEEDSEGVATRSTACIQKNRSGRSVQTSQKVYMAHALLNVYNKDPLNPPKLPKDAPFKLQRLIRPASKSDKKRLFKLRLRIAREKSGSSSSLIKSGVSCEVSTAASSSRNMKGKSESATENPTDESEKSAIIGTEEILRSNSPEKKEDHFRDPNLNLAGKLKRASRSVETDSGSSSRSSKNNSSRRGGNSSRSSNGVVPKKSETPDSSGSIGSEKSIKCSAEVVDDVSEIIADSCVSCDYASKKSGSADMPEGERTTNLEAIMVKAENESVKSESLEEGLYKMKENQEEMDVS
uniref:Uncharacterized protein n=1 Tax=Setaria digitata TaxID=48799 RepID=A0A915Q2I5_9BILA